MDVKSKRKKKQLEVELLFKSLEIEEKRKNVQAAEDKAWLRERDKNSDDDLVVTEKDDQNVQNLTENCVDSVYPNYDGLPGNIDDTATQQNANSLDKVVQPQADSTMIFANTHTVPRYVTSNQTRSEQSVSQVQSDTLFNSGPLQNQIMSTVPHANIVTNVNAFGTNVPINLIF